MSNHIVPSNQGSPFDGVRQVDDQGREFWSARDLQPLMGYSAWRNFMVPINRAMQSAMNQNVNLETNFARSRKITSTKPQDDLELSRYAAYLVAMNGDPNKPEVAGAQSYFAIQTRVAETQVTPQVEMSDDEILHRALEISAGRVKALEAKVEEIEPKAEAWSTLAGANGDYSVAEAAQVLSRDEQISIGRNRLFDFMGELGWLYRGRPRNSWHAYQDQVDNGRLVRRMSSAFQNQKTGMLELPAPTIRVTAKGVEALRNHLLKEAVA